MPIKKGYNAGGIRTLQELEDRCEIDDFTGCWHFLDFRGKRFTGKKVHIWDAFNQTAVSVVSYAWRLANPGKEIPSGMVAYRTCSCFDCANPEHIRIGNKAENGAAIRANGSGRTIVKINTAIKNGRKRSKLSQADRDAICTNGKSNKENAKKYGISLSYACAIRASVATKSSPFAQLFNFTQKKAA
jgi:hypothetical protein